MSGLIPRRGRLYEWATSPTIAHALLPDEISQRESTGWEVFAILPAGFGLNESWATVIYRRKLLPEGRARIME